MADVIDLASGEYRARVSRRGGALKALTWRGRALVLDPGDGEAARDELGGARGCAGDFLAPWPNRVADGAFVFGGQLHQLELTEPANHNANHGFVRVRDWEWVKAAGRAGTATPGASSATASTPGNTSTTESTCLTLELQMGPEPGWPWPLEYRATWALDAKDGLVGEFSATNRGDRDCPFGFGWHPYLSAQGAALDDCRVRLPAVSCLPLDARNLPAGVEVDAAEVLSAVLPAGGQGAGGVGGDAALAKREFAARGLWLDHAFRAGAEASFEACLTGPDGAGVRLWAGSWARWIQVYTADPGGPYGAEAGFPGVGRAIAVEPMTCPPDMLRSGVGMRVLRPGARACFRFGVAAI